MRVTLHKLKVHPDMSVDGTCFSAEVHVDGKKIGTVANAGRGGCHEYSWIDHETGQKLEEWANAQKVIIPADPEMEMDEFEVTSEKLDHFISEMLIDIEEAKDLVRICKKKTLIKLKGAQRGVYIEFKFPFSVEFKAKVQKKYGDQIEYFVNEKILEIVK